MGRRVDDFGLFIILLFVNISVWGIRRLLFMNVEYIYGFSLFMYIFLFIWVFYNEILELWFDVFICLDVVESFVVVFVFWMFICVDMVEMWNWGVLVWGFWFEMLLDGVWIIVRLLCIREWSKFLLCIIGVFVCFSGCILLYGVFFFFFEVVEVFLFDFMGISLVMGVVFVLFVSILCVLFFLVFFFVVIILVIRVVN